VRNAVFMLPTRESVLLTAE